MPIDGLRLTLESATRSKSKARHTYCTADNIILPCKQTSPPSAAGANVFDCASPCLTSEAQRSYSPKRSPDVFEFCTVDFDLIMLHPSNYFAG